VAQSSAFAAPGSTTEIEDGRALTPKFDADGLVTCVVTDAGSGEVLMVAHMNAQALAQTIATSDAWYYSRSRKKLWRKGEESGHTQKIREIRLDCDSDAILLRVEQVGGIACHTGRESCFFRKLEDGRWVTTDPVLKDPADIYKK
jgi:phosphoribosyl-AMP cyclohydrolase